MRRPIAVFVVMNLVACTNGGSRASEQLAALQKKKEADAKAKALKEEKPDVPQVEAIKLPAPYDDSGAVVILPDGPCPEGWWALFQGDVPGTSPDEKKANIARRKTVADEVRAKQYLVKLRAPSHVVLSPYDAPAGKFTIDVAGTIDCTDALGRIAVTWTDAKAGDPGNSAAKEGAEISQQVWIAPPVQFEYPLKSLTEAKAFSEGNRFGLSARVAFTPGKTEVDKKMKKVSKVTEKAAGETLSFGGGQEDWGAGRLVRAELLGLRVATEREKKMLFEKNGSK